MSGVGLDGVQCVQGQKNLSVFKGSDQDQGVQCHMLNNVMQISDHDHMWRSMIELDDEIQGVQIEMYMNIRGVHGSMTSEIQDGHKGGMMQMYITRVICVRENEQQSTQNNTHGAQYRY